MHRCVCFTGWLHFSSAVLRQDSARVEWRARWGGEGTGLTARGSILCDPECNVFRMSSECTSIKSCSHIHVTASKMHFHNWKARVGVKIDIGALKMHL